MTGGPSGVSKLAALASATDGAAIRLTRVRAVSNLCVRMGSPMKELSCNSMLGARAKVTTSALA
jgi:hypothetical protein